MMRRATITLVLVTLLTALLAACGGAATVPASTATAIPAATGGAGGAATAATPGTARAASPAAGGGILILAASDLQYALPEIAKAYEAATGRKVTISLGSTGTFASQIENGAPADLFFAADQSFIEQLQGKGFVRDVSRQIYAVGRIVLVSAKGVPAAPQTLADLLKPEYKKVAIANPEHAPYGRAARSALQAQGLWDQVQPKLVLGENISQTFQLAQTGNVDAAIVALSVALGIPGTPYTLIDDKLHPALTQEAAVLKGSKQPEVAADFLAYVNGPAGRVIMKKYGFVLPGE